MKEIFVWRCSKCKHNTPQQYRGLTNAVGDQPNTYQDIGAWEEKFEAMPRIKARQCLVCGTYFQAEEKEAKIKVMQY